MSHYNENDLKTIWYAYKGGMKKYQVAQLMGITEEETIKMLDAAQAIYGRGVGRPREEIASAKPRNDEKTPSFRREPEPEPIKYERPKAKYDNKSSEERINELLCLDV